MTDHIAPKLRPGQKIMVAPGLFGNNSATVAEQALHDERLVAKLDACHSRLYEDLRTIAKLIVTKIYHTKVNYSGMMLTGIMDGVGTGNGQQKTILSSASAHTCGKILTPALQHWSPINPRAAG